MGKQRKEFAHRTPEALKAIGESLPTGKYTVYTGKYTVYKREGTGVSPQVPLVSASSDRAAANRLWRRSALLRRFHFDNSLSLVGAAVWAHVVRTTQAAALRAPHEVHRRQRVVGPPATSPALGEFSLWLRWHSRNSSIKMVLSTDLIAPTTAGQAPVHNHRIRC